MKNRIILAILAVVLSLSLIVAAVPFAGADETTITPAVVVPETIDLSMFPGIENIIGVYDNWLFVRFGMPGDTYENARIYYSVDGSDLDLVHYLDDPKSVDFNRLKFYTPFDRTIDESSLVWASGVAWTRQAGVSSWGNPSVLGSGRFDRRPEIFSYIASGNVWGWSGVSGWRDAEPFFDRTVASLLLPNHDEPYHLNQLAYGPWGSGVPSAENFDIRTFGDVIADAWSDDLVPYSILMQHEYRRDWFTLVLSALPIEVQAVPYVIEPEYYPDFIYGIDWMEPIVFTNNALDSSVYKASIFEIFYDENTGEVYLSDTSYGIPADVSDISRYWTSHDIPLAFFDGMSYAYSGSPFYIASSGRIYDSTPPDPDDPDPPTDPDPDDPDDPAWWDFWGWFKKAWFDFTDWVIETVDKVLNPILPDGMDTGGNTATLWDLITTLFFPIYSDSAGRMGEDMDNMIKVMTETDFGGAIWD